ncbi:hypothetical protein AB0442_35140 [Kitasatospora sp. NPDC085895]|uniref:DUF732 domain-containing protein n=1 Tax=Kitasatospora sp. NPDC085895 TaxID=3155057 RepID=UPI00344E076D
MRTRMIVTTLTAAAALSLSLTACGSDGGGTAAPAKSSAATAAAPAASTPAAADSATPAASTAAPTAPTKAAGTADPTQLAKELAMVAGLKQIDPKLAADNQKTVAAAQQTCADIKAGKDDATVAKNTTTYFAATGAKVTDQQGQMIAVIVKAALCP